MRILKTIFLAIFICTLTIGKAKAQPNKPVPTDCSFNFEKDLKANRIKLLLLGGIAPIHVKGQKQHEKRFNFEYHDYGCIAESDECSRAYSAKAFKYLDKKYGKGWRKQVRQDVLYLTGEDRL